MAQESSTPLYIEVHKQKPFKLEALILLKPLVTRTARGALTLEGDPVRDLGFKVHVSNVE